MPMLLSELKYMFICFIGAREWCDHWKQCVWFTPEKGLRVCTDEAVQLRAIHTDTSISYDFGTQSCLKEVGYQQCAARIQKSQIALPPERMAIYGDNSWRCSFIKVLSNAVSSLTSQKNKKKSSIGVHIQGFKWTIWWIEFLMFCWFLIYIFFCAVAKKDFFYMRCCRR